VPHGSRNLAPPGKSADRWRHHYHRALGQMYIFQYFWFIHLFFKNQRKIFKNQIKVMIKVVVDALGKDL
jgi:hypothetical protein